MLRLSAPVWFANAIFARTLAAYRSIGRLDIDLSGRVVNPGGDSVWPLRVSQAYRDADRATHRQHRLSLGGGAAYLARAGHLAADLAQHCFSYSLSKRQRIKGSTYTGVTSQSLSRAAM
jgi:hypothetical protein